MIKDCHKTLRTNWIGKDWSMKEYNIPFCIATRYWKSTLILLLSILMALCMPVRWAATAQHLGIRLNSTGMCKKDYDRYGKATTRLTLGRCWASIWWLKMCNVINRYSFSFDCLHILQPLLKVHSHIIFDHYKSSGLRTYLNRVACIHENWLGNPINDMELLKRFENKSNHMKLDQKE